MVFPADTKCRNPIKNVGSILPAFLKLFLMGRVCRGKKGFVSAGKHNRRDVYVMS